MPMPVPLAWSLLTLHDGHSKNINMLGSAMTIPVYQVDAFTNALFAGNPAAVCPLDDWLDDAVMQQIAAENNLSETAFLVPNGNGYKLRWFTPTVEVALCGHATLASAHVIFDHLQKDATQVSFQTLSGELIVERDGDDLQMNFPSVVPQPMAPRLDLHTALGGAMPAEWFRLTRVHEADFFMLVYHSADEVAALRPDFKGMDANVIVTAKGFDVDFVSRFFAPASGIDEDPVTGSAHCSLTPYWAEKLGKTKMTARQISARGGELTCELKGDRVLLTGRCVMFMEGTIRL